MCRIPKTVVAVALWALSVLVAEAGGGLRSVDSHRRKLDKEEETDDGDTHVFIVSENPPMHFSDNTPIASPGVGGSTGKAPPVASGTLEGEKKPQTASDALDEEDLMEETKKERKREKQRMKESEAFLEEGGQGSKKKRKKNNKKKLQQKKNKKEQGSTAGQVLPSDLSDPALTPPTDINAANAATLSAGNSLVGFDLAAHDGGRTPTPAPAPAVPIPGDPDFFPTHDEFTKNKSPRPPANTPVGPPLLPQQHSGEASTTDLIPPSPAPTAKDHIAGDPASFPTDNEFFYNKSPGIPAAAKATAPTMVAGEAPSGLPSAAIPPPSPANKELEDEDER